MAGLVLLSRVETLLRRWAGRGIYVDQQAGVELLKLARDIAASKVMVAPLIEALLAEVRRQSDPPIVDVVPLHAIVNQFIVNADLPPPVCTGTGEHVLVTATPTGQVTMVCAICRTNDVKTDAGGRCLPHPYHLSDEVALTRDPRRL